MSSGNILVGRHQQGFTYLALMFAVAIMSAMLATTGIVWSQAGQRDREVELLFVGNQFRQAIALYYQRTPGAVKRYPQKIDDLIEDPALSDHPALSSQILRRPHDRQGGVGLGNGPRGWRHGGLQPIDGTANQERWFRASRGCGRVCQGHKLCGLEIRVCACRSFSSHIAAFRSACSTAGASTSCQRWASEIMLHQRLALPLQASTSYV